MNTGLSIPRPCTINEMCGAWKAPSTSGTGPGLSVSNVYSPVSKSVLALPNPVNPLSSASSVRDHRRVAVSAHRVGLPDLEEGILDRLAIAVEHSPWMMIRPAMAGRHQDVLTPSRNSRRV